MTKDKAAYGCASNNRIITSLSILFDADTFLEDLTNLVARYFEEGLRDTPRLTAKTWLKMKDQKIL